VFAVLEPYYYKFYYKAVLKLYLRLYIRVCVFYLFLLDVWDSQSQEELLRHISHAHTLTQPANSLYLLIAVLKARHKFQCHQTFIYFCNAALFSDLNFCPVSVSRQNLSLFLAFVIFICLAAGSCPKFALSA